MSMMEQAKQQIASIADLTETTKFDVAEQRQRLAAISEGVKDIKAMFAEKMDGLEQLLLSYAKADIAKAQARLEKLAGEPQNGKITSILDRKSRAAE